MNPLTLLPLLAAAAMAAPGVLLASNPGAITLTAPALQYQVPLTQTVHYENRPVVTGYQTTVVKPAIASAPVIAPLAVSGITSNIAIRQLPEFTPPPTNSTTPPPIGDAPTLPPLTPPTQAPPSENGTSGDQGGQQPPIPIPGIPGAIPQQSVVVQQAAPVAAPVAAPAPVADAVVVEARAAPVPVQTVAVRAAQAGDFEPLVTKEKVLAPTRVHTQVTPQLTQVVPEVTVRKIVHDVPVAVQGPVVHQVVQQVQTVQKLAPAQIVSVA